jgi:hypothetical protein
LCLVVFESILLGISSEARSFTSFTLLPNYYENVPSSNSRYSPLSPNSLLHRKKFPTALVDAFMATTVPSGLLKNLSHG